MRGFSLMDTLVPIENAEFAGSRPRLPEWLRKGQTHFSAVHNLKACASEVSIPYANPLAAQTFTSVLAAERQPL